MSDYIEVIEKKKVPRNCSTCLYYGSNGFNCGNANNYGKAMLLVNGGRACDYYWLDQNRFTRA